MDSKRGRGLSALPQLVAGVLAFIVLGNCPVFGQAFTASITGSPRDVSGAVIPGAAVTIKHLDTGLTRAAEADANGSFSASSLPVGAYEITAEKMGFRREVRRGLDLVVAQEAVVNLIRSEER